MIKIVKKIKNKKFLGLIIGLSFFMIILLLTLHFIFNNSSPTTINKSKLKLSVPSNTTPLKKTNNLTLKSAHKKDLELMKQEGKFFPLEFGTPDEVKKTLDNNSTHLFEFKEHNNKKYIKNIIKKHKTKKYVSDTTKNVVEQEKSNELWQYLWKLDDKIVSQNGDVGVFDVAYNQSQKRSDNISNANIDDFNWSCMVKAVTVTAVTSIVKREFPLVLKVLGPADNDCVDTLPYGTTVNAYVKADYDVMRATGYVTSITLPDGKTYPFAGNLFGPDKNYGIGLKIVRNDRKAMVLSALFGGVTVGFNTARQVAKENATKKQIVCFDWGCQEIEQQVKKRNPVREGALSGGEVFFHLLGKGVLEEYGRRSPILVEIPVGLPIFINPDILAVKYNHK